MSRNRQPVALSETFVANHPARVVLVTTHAMSVTSSQRIVGPPSTTWRRFQFDTRPGEAEFEITTEGRWELTVQELREGDPVDPVPMEDTLEPGLSLREELRQYIMEEVYRQNVEKDEVIDSPEEADDFDVEDEEEIASPYEFVELDEEIPLESDPYVRDNVSHGTTKEEGENETTDKQHAESDDEGGADRAGAAHTEPRDISGKGVERGVGNRGTHMESLRDDERGVG